jgi:hypothetical protein
VKQDYKEQLEALMEKMECPKDFLCYKSNFSKLCNTEYMRADEFWECRDKTPLNCSFSALHTYTYLCRCPLRHYIAEKLEM